MDTNNILLDREDNAKITRLKPEFEPIEVNIKLKDRHELDTFINAIRVWDTEIADVLKKELDER